MWAVAPVRVEQRVAAAVLVARGRPPGAVARELAPWLAAGLAVLLVAGTALASLAVFRPAHARLRDLEDAVRRFGDGDRTARASARGGDEVSAVARAFNRMADEAAAREAALVDADRARRQLLADVSHELRTPLTSIRGYAETLTVPGFAPATPQGQHAVHVVGVEAQRLERIVNDLLDLARLDAGGAPLEMSTVPIRDLFTRVQERHGPAASRVGGDARAQPWTTARPWSAATPSASNRCCRISPPTPCGTSGAVGTCGCRRAATAIEVVIRVTDDGAGIAPAHLPHVFDRFYKADPSRTGGAGTGLGLSIVKAIVERHGGTVRVSSTPGVTTSFEIRLPA